jgi:hypothetical protein
MGALTRRGRSLTNGTSVWKPVSRLHIVSLITFIGGLPQNLDGGSASAREEVMAEHDEVYDQSRADRLVELLRGLADRILELDRQGRLLSDTGVPELLRLMGDARAELFHYEVRSTYDTPEVAESRRIVDEARRTDALSSDEPEDDEPWRGPRPA